MPEPLDDARRLLGEHFGYPDFRPAQLPVIRSVLAGRDTLAVLPTGGGKSVCFQIPALVLDGFTVVVSPLIALMQDQVAAAVVRGIPAAALHSGIDAGERARIREALASGELRLLYASPERLSRLAPELRDRGLRPRLLAVDEAHCIAEWGHDFRPSYRSLGGARYRLGRPPVVALTGSATPEVRRDIARTLGFRPHRWDEHLGSFDRANLWFGVVPVRNERERLQALLRLLAGDDRMIIVYAPTRSTTEAIARALREAGHRSAPYHAGLTREQRSRTLDAFLRDRLDVIVATCAFGMGIDKPRIRMVVHWTLPATPEAYYQEAGRAGRDGEFARCVLLWRPGDAVLHRRQLDVTYPPRRLLERLWRDGERCTGVPANVRASAERLRHELHPERGPVDWSAVADRRRKAEARIAAVEAYANGSGCRRRALLAYFGERLERCAGCDRCRSRRTTAPCDPEVASRLARLRTAVATRTGPWGGALLEPDVLLALARCPPQDAAELADVPGVGAALAEQCGRTILHALGVTPATAAEANASPRLLALRAWRRRTAADLGVPPYAVLGDAALARLAAAPAAAEADIAAVPGVGPRVLAKFGAELLRVIAGGPHAGYLGPMEQGDAEILERIDAGERVFRPGVGEDRARETFEALVRHLRELRERGLIDLPERGAAYADEDGTGAYPMAGPCYVTELGREALLEFRRGDRRTGERRGDDRRTGAAPRPAEEERRHQERRRSDRRR